MKQKQQAIDPGITQAARDFFHLGDRPGHDGNYPVAEYRGALTHSVAAFTDAFAPVERYTLDMVR